MSLLFEDKPLVINPKLAELIGLNEAIIIQQMNYWLKRSDKFIDDKAWIYNSAPQWQKQFPFFSESTIKRTITSLESKGLLFIGNYNKDGRDRTKWYSINYDALNQLVSDASCQNERCIDQIEPMHDANLTRPLPENTTETTTENKKINKKSSVTVPEMINSLSGLSEDVAIDYLKHRKDKGATLSPRAWAGICREVNIFTEKTNLTPDDALIEAIERDWKGLKADWLIKSLTSPNSQPNQHGSNEQITDVNDPRHWAYGIEDDPL